MPTAIVIGAGLAGLTTAHRLQQAGWVVTVLESDESVGGRTRTAVDGHFRFDTGALGFGTVYQDMMQLIHELELDHLLTLSSSKVAVVRNGQLHEIDSSRKITAARSKLFGSRSLLKFGNLVVDLLRVRRTIDIRDVAAAHELDNESVADYAGRRLNAEILEYFLEPATRLINLCRAEQVSKLELFNSLNGLLDTQLVHLLGGIQTLIDAIEKNLAVRLSTPAVEVHADEVGVRVRAVDHGNAIELAGDYCVLATTLPTAVELYSAASAMLAPLSSVLDYSPAICVHLGYDARPSSGALSVMLPLSEDDEIAVVFLEHNKAPDRAPPTKSVMTAVLDGIAAKALWEEADDVLIERIASRVERLFPEIVGTRELVRVTRWRTGLTVPSPGIYRAMNEVNARLKSSDRVQFVGDYRSVAGQNSAIAWANKVSSDLISHAGR